MKIMIVGSIARSLVNFRGDLIRSLLAAGFEVHAIAPDFCDDSRTAGELKDWGVRTHSFRLRRASQSPFFDLLAFFDLLSLFRKIQPTVFFGYTAKPVIYGGIASWLSHVPHRIALITGLGFGFQGGYWRAPSRLLVRALYFLGLRTVSALVFQNKDDFSEFTRLGLIASKSRVEIVNGSGVNLDFFECKPLPEGPLTFLMISRLIGDKGVREYAEAAKRLKKKYPKVNFVLVGPEEHHPDSVRKEELSSWISSGAIDYLGALDDVRGVLANCHVYVLPSYREGTPRSILEALATGRAVITTDAPGCRETVTDQVNGFLTATKSVESLEAAIEKFIVDPSIVSEMGVASRKIALEKFDVRTVNSRLIALILSYPGGGVVYLQN